MAKKEDGIAMAKAYEPKSVEARLYKFWEESGFFTPKIDPAKEPFTIIMPPPNVTGELHLGHALTTAIEDSLIRWRRMQGYPTLWLPGTDHAGIAGQYVVEKDLAKQGLTRFDVGREKFLELVWDWMGKYGNIISQQHRRLGASCDWTREKFTMGPGPSKAVRYAFKHLYDKGLIYQGERIINWCPRCGTALSDLEVEHKDVVGKLYYIRYPFLDVLQEKDGAEPTPHTPGVVVATTRPETMLGDTAVAVNPGDERYNKLIGRTLLLPIVRREIPIIGDDVVDPAFGTGAVKVTPAHDPVDFEIGQRHHLPSIKVMNLDGTMNFEAGHYAEMTTVEARECIVMELEKEGLLVKVEPYDHSVGHCERCGVVVEPMISKQWFVTIKPLAKPAIEAVKDGRITFVPERFSKVYLNWMENIRDWTISRQIWWGHRIPIWYCKQCSHIMVTTEEKVETCEVCGGPVYQDPNVLDTWFSSGLWPFSTLGWPDDTEDLRYFYPTSVMETGWDIIFFWVARMIMQGLEMMGDVPFRYVYIHGLIRDETGRKMSKTAGNVVNPLEIMDEYGTDALRFALLTGTAPGTDIRLSTGRLEAGRNFANKLWNATRFVVSSEAEPKKGLALDPDNPAFTLSDRWILSRHNRLIVEATRLMEEFQLGEAAKSIYDFLWSEFADWYIEASKIRLYSDDHGAKAITKRVLTGVLERTLRLLHPYMPFVTEELWQQLPHEGPSIMIAPWPQAEATDEEAEADFALVMDIIRDIRNVRAEKGVAPGRWIEAIIAAGPKAAMLESQADVISRLARVDRSKLTIPPSVAAAPPQSVALVVGGVTVYLPLAGMVDLAAERTRLQTEIDATEHEIERAEALLANEGFVQRAPEQVVNRERDKLAAAREKLALLRERKGALAG